MKFERFPNINRVSVVVATILLTYGLTQIIGAPQAPQNYSVGGFLVPISFNFSTLITFAVAAITASGTDWILRDHPELKDRSIIPHLFLPAIAAWAQNIILNNMPNTPLKWIVFLGGGAFLFIVILSEYIAIFQEDYRRLLAISLLTALSYGLFLTLTVALEPVLVFGLGPIPRLGVTGSAWAYLLGFGAGLALQVAALLRRQARIGINLRNLRPDLPLMAHIVRIALPSTIQMTLRSSSRLAIVGLVGAYGTFATAGYGVANRMLLIALIPGFGLGNAAGTLVGQNLGARKPGRAER